MTAHAPFNLVTGPQAPSKKLRLHFLDLGGLKSAFAFSPSPSTVPDSQSKSASVRTASCGVQRPAADQVARLMAREHPPNVRTAPCTFPNILLFGRFFLFPNICVGRYPHSFFFGRRKDLCLLILSTIVWIKGTRSPRRAG